MLKSYNFFKKMNRFIQLSDFDLVDYFLLDLFMEIRLSVFSMVFAKLIKFYLLYYRI